MQVFTHARRRTCVTLYIYIKYIPRKSVVAIDSCRDANRGNPIKISSLPFYFLNFLILVVWKTLSRFSISEQSAPTPHPSALSTVRMQNKLFHQSKKMRMLILLSQFFLTLRTILLCQVLDRLLFL